ncbi:hypothetical protein [Paraburkholderia caribensis]|uniref:hypothetical protein n=1 Tax=Paraburkholderia caribensis TaxID=75105 RepID=UPI00078E158D|nr:hypothetical protein [Paraburkholderia caribensis]AMV47769.1 hypothetical protein ATN79_44695 [Paraburkholderia caribensis]
MAARKGKRRHGAAKSVRNPYLGAGVEILYFDTLSGSPETFTAYFYSNVLQAMVWLAGPLRIKFAVLLEIEAGVTAYTFSVPIQIPVSIGGADFNISPDVELIRFGKKIWVTIEERPPETAHWKARMKAINEVARARGIEHRIFSDKDFEKLEVYYENSMFLMPKMSSVTPDRFDLYEEEEAFSKRICENPNPSLEELLTLPGINAARMMSVVGRNIRKGKACANLKDEMFTLLSIVRPNGGNPPAVVFDDI